MADRVAVAALLGREPQGAFVVVVRDELGAPVVIRNAPLLDDGTPMPTRYWLVSPALNAAVGRLEAAGGVRRAEREVPAGALADAHLRYAAERDAALPPGHLGPAPSGGVGGTRRGRQVPPRPLRLAPGRRRRPGRAMGRGPAPAADGALVTDGAAIDLGSNAARLLVRRDGRAPLRRSHLTHLSADVPRTGRLGPDALERTAAVLRGYRALIDEQGVPLVATVATAAARERGRRRRVCRGSSPRSSAARCACSPRTRRPG